MKTYTHEYLEEIIVYNGKIITNFPVPLILRDHYRWHAVYNVTGETLAAGDGLVNLDDTYHFYSNLDLPDSALDQVARSRILEAYGDEWIRNVQFERVES